MPKRVFLRQHVKIEQYYCDMSYLIYNDTPDVVTVRTKGNEYTLQPRTEWNCDLMIFHDDKVRWDDLNASLAEKAVTIIRKAA